MALPEKVVEKPCKECGNVKEIKVKEENETEIKEMKLEEERNIIPKEEKLMEDEIERKENTKPSLVNPSLVNYPLLSLVCFLNPLQGSQN
jgi:AT-rich interactive domain-containing protein 4B